MVGGGEGVTAVAGLSGKGMPQPTFARVFNLMNAGDHLITRTGGSASAPTSRHLGTRGGQVDIFLAVFSTKLFVVIVGSPAR